MNLRELLIDLSAVTDAELEKKGRELYRTYCLDNDRFGVRLCHDGQKAIFHATRFSHAFYDKPSRWSYVKSRDLPDESRLERVRWIGEVVGGKAPDSECWEVPGPDGRRRPPNRLYLVWPENYVVWLEPRTEGGWKFSTAYVKTTGRIRDYCRGGSKVWAYKETPRDQTGSRDQKPAPPP
jgi:hypothetical protein